jgi:hypothetical protein
LPLTMMLDFAAFCMRTEAIEVFRRPTAVM